MIKTIIPYVVMVLGTAFMSIIVGMADLNTLGYVLSIVAYVGALISAVIIGERGPL